MTNVEVEIDGGIDVDAQQVSVVASPKVTAVSVELNTATIAVPAASDLVVVETPAQGVVTEALSVAVVSAGSQGPAGPPGPQGEQGDVGPRGDPGSAGGVYTYQQVLPSDTWVINHNLSYIPEVIVLDSTGAVVEGTVTYPDTNNLILTFSAAFAGTAYVE